MFFTKQKTFKAKNQSVEKCVEKNQRVPQDISVYCLFDFNFYV